MKTSFILLALCLLFTATSVYCQTTVTFQPSATYGKDAEVFSLNGSLNLGTTPNLRGNAWTFGGEDGVIRRFLDFDLQSIPAGAEIVSATLHLYSLEPGDAQEHSGDNSLQIRRVLSYWHEDFVTWDQQPSATTSLQVTLPASQSSTDDYENIDVTSLVQAMSDNPSSAYGFMLRLETETPMRRMGLSSSDHADPNRHPKLVVTYFPPSCNYVVLQPANGKDAEVFSLDPNLNLDSDLLRANAWTFGGEDGIERAFFAFDLSSIAPQTEVIAAYLTLFSPDAPNTQTHAGDNTAVLHRVTGPWTESTITWNNQPAVTDVNEAEVAESDLEYQEYRRMDVTSLVQDMIQDPANSHGFRLSLRNESSLRRMAFASSDAANTQLHPKLELCLGEIMSSHDITAAPFFSVHPNPAVDVVTIQTENSQGGYLLKIMDPLGRTVDQQVFYANTTVDISGLPSATYVVQVQEMISGRFSTLNFVKL